MEKSTCIYCKKEKALDEFDTEHVIQQSLGKFENNLTLHCVCKECNQFFGDSIDLIFGRDSIEALLRYHHRIKSIEDISDLK